jgi:dienelactone hydrolase
MRIGAYLAIFFTVLAVMGCGTKEYPSVKDNSAGKLIGKMDFNKVKWKLESVKGQDILRAPVEGIVITHFKLDAGEAGSTDGYIFAPSSKGNYPGVFYMHWLGGTYPVNSGMHYFLTEAAQMAANGHICIVPQGFFPWSQAPSGDKDDAVKLQKQLQQMLGALMLLINQDNIDRSDISFVGHDYGAMHGLVLVAGTEIFSRAVFMAPNDNYADWNRILKSMPEKTFSEYSRMLSEWNPLNTAAILPDIPLLFQFSKTDQFVSQASAQAVLDKAPKSATVLWYPQGHALGEEAKNDRVGFLMKP